MIANFLPIPDAESLPLNRMVLKLAYVPVRSVGKNYFFKVNGPETVQESCTVLPIPLASILLQVDANGSSY
jgi:hypothetical protein